MGSMAQIHLTPIEREKKSLIPLPSIENNKNLTIINVTIRGFPVYNKGRSFSCLHLICPADI